ncbi:S9 family peptidase [Legionella sp. km772]|uniref:alpha/beta hydrolase family protein n=1 Tax=Legionella sp. km772 TaxID=2498111 RepID=UPI000F8CD859|nr:alpha/beta fold hydrolase [Legionella sp. km772]RUR11156.1 alpha/beta fold hydrolase [Legionella sp. km772]
MDLIKPALYNAQLTRTLGHASYQGAEIGECLTVATQIETANRESWYEQWLNLAHKNLAKAEYFSQRKQQLDAKLAFLRASNYYRTAYFFLEDEPHDPRIEYALKLSISSFKKAINFFTSPVETISIPFEQANLPGYLYLAPATDKKPKPLIIDTGGGDGTKEESYFNVAAEAIQRGFHCLSLEGPGQGSVLRLDKIPFIPDWERVIEAVIDYIIHHPEIDEQRIVLIGRSFGGYLAGRAVTKERRIAACIVDPGILDSMGSLEQKCRTAVQKNCPELGHAPLPQIIEYLMKIDNNLRFMLASRLWRFGAHTIEDLVEQTHRYTLKGIVEDIQCPMLVCDNTLEYITPGQAQQFYDQLRCKKHYVLFNEENGTGGHCEPLAPRLFYAEVYSWLADCLKRG